jgi:hypothetical protein
MTPFITDAVTAFKYDCNIDTLCYNDGAPVSVRVRTINLNGTDRAKQNGRVRDVECLCVSRGPSRRMARVLVASLAAPTTDLVGCGDYENAV